MTHLNAAIHDHLATQHGIVSVEQMLATGVTHSQIRQWEAARVLERVLNTAYRTPSVPLDELARCVAVSVGRPGAAISGPTAGRLWGLRRLPRDQRIHLLAPPASHPVSVTWALAYRTAAFHPDDLVDRPDGIRVTSRARTALDLARWLRPPDLLSVIEQVMHDGNLDEDDLRQVAVDWMSSQRPWVRTFLQQLECRLPGAAAESHPEVRVAALLERAGVRGIVRQFPIDLPGYGRARFDLALPHLRWAIEVDVHPVHDETAGRLSDLRRDEAATAIGWRVTRISRKMYETALSSTIDDIVSEYRADRRFTA